MKRGRADRTLIVAGLATVALGTLLLLDRTGTIDVQFNYMLPAVLAAIGAVLAHGGAGRMSAAPVPLRRAPAHGYIGGVCAGFAARLGIDPILIRIGFVLTLLAGGAGIPLYAIGWALIPAEGPERPVVVAPAQRAATPGWSRPGWPA